MAQKVTLQDIADELGVSRNTVSKAINNTGILSETTRKKVLAKAIEMGYKQFSYVDFDNASSQLKAKNTNTEIALLTTWFLNSSHFSAPMLDKFQLEISKFGYSMSMHILQNEDIKNCTLPASLHTERLAGILCIEVFDYDYAAMLSNSSIPVLFVDSPVDIGKTPLCADRLLMENSSPIISFIQNLKQREISHIGFVGEYMHCQSFFERYMAYRSGMTIANLAIHKEWILTKNKPVKLHPDNVDYQSYLQEELEKLTTLPQAFICANDFVAIDLLHVLNRMKISIPDEVKILGFDDAPESRIIHPNLSTVHIHSQSLGFSATQLLLSRINEPDMNFRTMHCETNLVLRTSTGDDNDEKSI